MNGLNVAAVPFVGLIFWVGWKILENMHDFAVGAS